MSRKYFELAFELSGKTNSTLKSTFKGLKVDVDGLNKKIANLEKARGDTKRFEGLRKDILKTNREFNEAQKKVKELSKEIKNTANPSQKLQTEFQKSQKEVSNLSNKLEKQKEELRQLKGSMSEAGISTKNFAKDQANLEEKLRKTIKAQTAYNTSKNNLEAAKAQTAAARGKLVDAVAMGATLAVPVKLAIDAENTMADIKKVVDFASKEEIKAMEKSIMKITTDDKIPMTFNQIGEIIAAGGQAGLQKADLTQFAIDSAKMGVAFDIQAGEAGQMMAEWRAAFRMNQKEVVVLADKINYLGNTTAASAPKISEVVSRIGPLGDVGGVASGEIAALGATLVGMGVGEEIAATGIKNLILTMNKGSAATKKQRTVYKSLGLDAEKMAKKMQTDSKGAILELLNALKQVPEHARAAQLEQLVGKESIGAIAPLLTNIKELEKNFNAVNEAQKKFAGSMEGEFQARAATTENSVILLKNQMHNMGITLGSTLLPPIVQLATIVGGAASKVQEFADKYPNLTKWIVMGTAAFLAFNVVLIAGVYAGRLLKESYLSVGHGIKTIKLLWAEGKIQAIGYTVATKTMTAVQWALNAAMNANPIGIVIALVAALVAGLVILYNKSEKARAIMDNMWNGIKEGALKAFNSIKEGWEKLKNFFKNPIKGEVNISKKGLDNNSKGLPAYAKGGIVSSPQIALIGEGRASEAIIPLEKTANSIGLWERAGRALGMDMSPKGIDIASRFSTGKGSTINNTSDGDKYEFNFNIDAKGAAPGIEELIKDKLLLEVIPIIMRLLKEKDKDKLRVSINNG